MLYNGEPPSKLAEEVFALSCESEKLNLIAPREASDVFEKICSGKQRLVTPRDIYSIGAYVAQRLRDNAPQIFFPKADGDQFKINQITSAFPELQKGKLVDVIENSHQYEKARNPELEP